MCHGTQVCAPRGACMQATEAGHEPCRVPGTQASSRDTACLADWDSQAAFPDAGMQQAPNDTGCCCALQASWQRCCVCQTPSLRPGAGQGLRQRSCPTVRTPRTWQPSSCPWTAACRAWCSPPCSCRGGTGVPSRWGCSRQSAPGADSQECTLWWPAAGTTSAAAHCARGLTARG